MNHEPVSAVSQEKMVRQLRDLIARVEGEAATASRAGQHFRLSLIADDLREMLHQVADAPTRRSPAAVTSAEWAKLARWWDDVWQAPRTEEKHKRNLREVVNDILTARALLDEAEDAPTLRCDNCGQRHAVGTAHPGPDVRGQDQPHRPVYPTKSPTQPKPPKS